jgi:hypothetical protein
MVVENSALHPGVHAEPLPRDGKLHNSKVRVRQKG